ncbi:MAG: hypothetical protein A2687_04195 [Candidatus Levybacteria bacterium RIFCSPHIGHO2_01_FULL_38_26]|nr:MAG: hypothetical protein A2687_04195 [Candidatus Levybacteria bacterium RIFCSPHIGHO2_01_FULL_38_26]
MNNFQIVFKNTSFLFFSEVVIKILGLFYFVFLARNLSVDIFGRYNLVTSFVTIFSFLPDIGIGLVVVREIAQKKYDLSLLLGNTFIISAVMSLVAMLVIITAGIFLGFTGEVILLLFISSLTLLFSQIRSIPLFYFDGIERMEYSAVLKAVNSLLLIGFGLTGYILGFGLIGIIGGFLVGSVLSFLITWIVFLLKKIKINLRFDKTITKRLFYDGFPLGIAAFSSLVYGTIDGIMLERMISESALGIYSSAVKFGPTILQLLNVPFIVAVYPALSRLSADTIRFKKAILKSVGAVLLWSLPVSFGVAFFADIIPVIFGQKYNMGVPILRVLIFFVPFAAVSAVLYKVLIVIRKQNLYLAISIFGVVVNVVLNFVLIEKFQIMGAAFAAVVTQAGLFLAYAVAVYYFVVRYAKVRKK